MAWRIEESVRRGEIDARERGVVRGRLWLHGLNQPVLLELWGNACPDLAGCLLEFENSADTLPLPLEAPFALLQHGVPGDMTASRKVRLPALPRPSHHLSGDPKAPFSSETLATGLYLEWFSEKNGRVVIEGTGFKTTLSLPAWRLSSAEEFEREREAADAFGMFVNRLSQAVEAAKHTPPADRKWNEFDYEKMMRESDARREKYLELIDKFHDHPDQDRIIARLMGWKRKDKAAGSSQVKSGAVEPEEGSTHYFEDACQDSCQDCAPTEPDLTTEGIDWVRDENGSLSHPLAMRALKMGLLLWQRCQTSGLELGCDEDLARLVSENRTISASLSGALDELAYGRDKGDPAYVVARLKRVLPHVNTAQGALERVTRRHLLADPIAQFTRAELFSIREEVLRLMAEFRAE